MHVYPRRVGTVFEDRVLGLNGIEQNHPLGRYRYPLWLAWFCRLGEIYPLYQVAGRSMARMASNQHRAVVTKKRTNKRRMPFCLCLKSRAGMDLPNKPLIVQSTAVRLLALSSAASSAASSCNLQQNQLCPSMAATAAISSGVSAWRRLASNIRQGAGHSSQRVLRKTAACRWSVGASGIMTACRGAANMEPVPLLW